MEEPKEKVEIEKEIIKKETRCILDKCFEIGENDIALGVIRAFKGGILDIPFAPSIHTMGKILPARDNNGAIRILNPGQIPFTDEIIDWLYEHTQGVVALAVTLANSNKSLLFAATANTIFLGAFSFT